MNKAQLVDGLVASMADQGHVITKTMANDFLDCQALLISNALYVLPEEPVVLPGLGKFNIKHQAARKARNPATGEEVDVAAKAVPKFSASKGLKDRLNDV